MRIQKFAYRVNQQCNTWSWVFGRSQVLKATYIDDLEREILGIEVRSAVIRIGSRTRIDTNVDLQVVAVT